jgi:hypothetical protein
MATAPTVDRRNSAVKLLKDVVALRQQIDHQLDRPAPRAVPLGSRGAPRRVTSAPAPQVPPLLAALLRGVYPDAPRLTDDLAIVCGLMPPFLQAVAAGTNQDADAIDVFTITEAMRGASDRDTATDRDREQIAAIRRALTAAGRDADDDLADLRISAGEHGFVVGVAFAYHLLTSERP